jgi:P pilus assembly chaperone PapD
MKRYTNLLLRAAVVLSLISSAQVLLAQGLMVNPKRIMLDDRKRNDVVTLFNTGDDTSSYIISFKHFEMLPDGAFKDVDTSVRNYVTADSMLRFFPLEVTLAPHESQTIKVRFMKPKDLAVGEYRSHLYFRSIDRTQSLEQKQSDTAKTISLSLHPIFGLTIPLIVRNGTIPAKVGLDGMTLSPIDTAGKVIVTASIHRSGDESCYGTFVLDYLNSDGKVTELTALKGVAVYAPLTSRTVKLQFKIPDGVDMTTGTLRLEYQTLTDNPKETTLASAELPLKKG